MTLSSDINTVVISQISYNMCFQISQKIQAVQIKKVPEHAFVNYILHMYSLSCTLFPIDRCSTYVESVCTLFPIDRCPYICRVCPVLCFL